MKKIFTTIMIYGAIILLGFTAMHIQRQNDVINEYDEELIKNIIRTKKVNLFDEIKNYKMILRLKE